MAEVKLEKGKKIEVILDPQTDQGIRKIVDKIAEDIYKVSGTACEIKMKSSNIKQTLIVATIGDGTLSKKLKDNIGELKNLEEQTQSYGFYLLKNPLQGVENGLVICGSDKLGTIYGLFHLSELLGVTPYGFWGDVEVPSYKKVVLYNSSVYFEKNCSKEELFIEIENKNSKEPSVKYRGFFINDEWPCFGNWTFSKYGGFTAQMYDKVFEFLLRMKGNYIWPAMWTSSFFLDGPGMASMELADEYGIYIGMSHHEPCMRSSEEWDLEKGEHTAYGKEWDYLANKQGLLRYWEDGLKRSKGHNVFPTIGMRGERDSKMLGDTSSVEENVRLLKEIITNQRKLIAKYINSDLSKVPQLFAAYKEVEDYYFGKGQNEQLCGFEELEGVTLLLCDDNFGNMRALPPKEQMERAGGFGMYYHLDYHGAPVSYEWLNSTPLSKIWEQMTQAYDYGIRELWIANVGDLKFQEFPLGYFMELAYDFEAFGSKAINKTGIYTKEWVKAQFGAYTTNEQQTDIAWVLTETARLNGLRRPESCNDKVYHPVNYMEGTRMLERCQKLEEVNENVREQLKNKKCEDAYFSMIYYPAAASANLLKMHLYAGFNHLYAEQGRAITNLCGIYLKNCIDRDTKLSDDFKSFRNGKWSEMEKAFHIGFTNWNSDDWKYPICYEIRLPKEKRLSVSKADECNVYTSQYFPVPMEIDDFMDYDINEVIIQLANTGEGSLEWYIKECPDFIEIYPCNGIVEIQEEVKICINWEKLKLEEEQRGVFYICSDEEVVPVVLRAKKREIKNIPSKTALPRKGIFAINAANFAENKEGIFQTKKIKYEMLKDYGKHCYGMKVLPAYASFTREENAPHLIYKVWTEKEESYQIELHTSPANPLIYGGTLIVGISVNEEKMKPCSIVSNTYRGGEHTCKEWAKAVLAQEHICKTEVILKKGLNKIAIFAQDPGIVLECIVAYPNEKPPKKSYLGPVESFKI